MQPVESKMEYAVLVVVPQHEPVPGVPTRAAVRFTRQSKAGKDATVAVALRGAFMVCTVSQLLVIYVLASQPRCEQSLCSRPFSSFYDSLLSFAAERWRNRPSHPSRFAVYSVDYFVSREIQIIKYLLKENQTVMFYGRNSESADWGGGATNQHCTRPHWRAHEMYVFLLLMNHVICHI